MSDVTIFINKMKVVFNLLPDEEIDTYNDIYNESTEEFITWINRKYEEFKNTANSNGIFLSDPKF